MADGCCDAIQVVRSWLMDVVMLHRLCVRG